MIDSLGNTVDGTLTTAGWTGAWNIPSTWGSLGDFTPAPGTTTWGLNEIDSYWHNSSLANTPTLTLGGLNASLKYNVYIYSKTTHPNYNGDAPQVDVNGTSLLMAPSPRTADLDEDLFFGNLSLNQDGNLVIAMSQDGENTYHPTLNAVIVQAIPEPSAFGMLLGLATFIPMLIRRRKRA